MFLGEITLYPTLTTDRGVQILMPTVLEHRKLMLEHSNFWWAMCDNYDRYFHQLTRHRRYQ